MEKYPWTHEAIRFFERGTYFLESNMFLERQAWMLHASFLHGSLLGCAVPGARRRRRRTNAGGGAALFPSRRGPRDADGEAAPELSRWGRNAPGKIGGSGFLTL